MLALALPVILAELGWMAMPTVDTMMVGRLGADAIGAVSIGRALFISVAVVGIGLLLGLDTLVAQAHGAGEADACHRWLLHGAYLGSLISLPLFLLLRSGIPLLDRWGVEPAVLELTRPYLRSLSWSLLPLLLYAAFRRYLQAVNLVRPVMFALTSANLVHLLGNWILIFGRLGMPAMGVEGAGWSTCISSWYMALVLLAAIGLRESEQGWGLLRISWRPEAERFGRLLALGVPAAAQLLLEVGAFAAATALAGRLPASALAAHQIALTACSVTYMIPLGISSAAAVRVGQALGRRDRAGARNSGWAALTLGGGFMCVAALVFVLMPRGVVRLFSADPDVIASGVSLLAIAALFQLFDGLQAVATGALRGAGDTRTAMLGNLVGHWALGLPVGYHLCFGRGWGAVGLWTGWLIGLGVVSLVLVFAWSRRARAPECSRA